MIREAKEGTEMDSSLSSPEELNPVDILTLDF
jgi:hypothetical protein